METRTFYGTALKSGTGFQVWINKMVVRDLEIEKGDQLMLIVTKTGKKGRSRPDAKFPDQTETAAEAPRATPKNTEPEVPEQKSGPTPTPINYTKIDDLTKGQILAKIKKESWNLVISQASTGDDYDKEDFLNDPDIALAIKAQKDRERRAKARS